MRQKIFGILGLILLGIVLLCSYGTVLADPADYIIESMTLDRHEITLSVGETFTFAPVFAPADTRIRYLYWFSSNPAAADVDAETNTLTAYSSGSAVLYAETFDGAFFDTCTVHVEGNSAEGMASHSAFIGFSEKDLAKIKDTSLRNYITFLTTHTLSDDALNRALDREFLLIAEVQPGTLESESQKALGLGMRDASQLTVINSLAIRGTLGQLLDWISNNDAVISVDTDGMLYLIDPMEEESYSDLIGKGPTMILEGSVEALTTISALHNMDYKGAGQTIAVLDTGLNYLHDQFSGRVIGEYCYSASDDILTFSVCADGANITENQAGASAPNTENPDLYNHGSHVTGIAAGSNGIAPNAKIISFQVFSEYRTKKDIMTYYSDVLLALNKVIDLADNGTDITAVNLSLGGALFADSCDTANDTNRQMKKYFDSLLERGIIPVVSAGNDYLNGKVTFPACLSNAYTVGALADQSTPQIADYSNHSKLIDLLAPGTNLRSAFYYNSTAGIATNAYGRMSGTSMAAPVVAGTFLLLDQALGDWNDTATIRALPAAISTKTATRASITKRVLDLSRVADYIFLAVNNIRLTSGADSIKVSGTLAAKATGLNVAAYADPDSAVPLFTTAATGNTATLSRLDHNTFYYLDIRQYRNISGNHLNGEPDRRWGVTIDVPTVTYSIGEADITATWTGPTGFEAEASPMLHITGKKNGINSELCTINTVGGTCSIPLTDVKPDPLATITLTAYITVEDPDSDPHTGPNSVSASMLPVSPYSGPEAYQGSQQIYVTYDRDDSVTGHYVIVTRVSDGKAIKKVYVTSKKNPDGVVITGLKNGVEYNVSVQKYLTVGKKKIYTESDPVPYPVTPAAVPVTSPENVTATADNKKVTITFDKWPAVTGFSAQIYRVSDDKLIRSGVIKSSASLNRGVLSKLVNGELYRLVATHYNTYSKKTYRGTPAEEIYFVPLSAPTGVKITGSNVTIDADSAATGFTVYYRDITSSAFSAGCTASMGSACTISGLDENTNYELFVMKYKTANGKDYYGQGIALSNGVIVSKSADYSLGSFSVPEKAAQFNGAALYSEPFFPKSIPAADDEEDERMNWFLLDEWN